MLGARRQPRSGRRAAERLRVRRARGVARARGRDRRAVGARCATSSAIPSGRAIRRSRPPRAAAPRTTRSTSDLVAACARPATRGSSPRRSAVAGVPAGYVDRRPRHRATTRSCSTAGSSRSRTTRSPARHPIPVVPFRFAEPPGPVAAPRPRRPSGSTTTRSSAAMLGLTDDELADAREPSGIIGDPPGGQRDVSVAGEPTGVGRPSTRTSAAQVAICGVGESEHTKASGRTTSEIVGRGGRARARRRGPRADRRRRPDAHPAAATSSTSPRSTSTSAPTTTSGSRAPAAGCAGPRPRRTTRPQALRDGQGHATSSTRSVSRGRPSGARWSAAPAQSHAQELFKQNLEIPMGWFPQPVYFATIARRHMHEFGTTQEQLGAIAVACRRHANLTPGAVMHDKPLTLRAVPRVAHDRRAVPQGGLLPHLRRRRRRTS